MYKTCIYDPWTRLCLYKFIQNSFMVEIKTLTIKIYSHYMYEKKSEKKNKIKVAP